MKKPILFLGLLATFLVGCSALMFEKAGPSPTIPAQVSLEGLTVENYPSVDGSTSTRPLQQQTACHVFGLNCIWYDGFFFDETRNILPDLDNPAAQEGMDIVFNLQHSGTHDAYMNLIRGEAELILVARAPSEDEIRAARLRRVSLDYRPVALDAFVFLVNTENPVENLQVEEIRKIYTGKITSWDQIGVDLALDGNRMITSYRRNENSGSQELMEALVMQGEEMIDAPDLLLMGMMGPFYAIGGDVLGIGYSVYFYAAYMLPTETVRMAAVEGVLPTDETISDGTYPFVTEVFVVLRGDADPESPEVRLRNWLLTPEGQAVVAESGYIPVIGEN
ncbi:MAG: substrate-binding domain-containing protein [Anaerolineales bacterium]|nr:substrate-binding domain-containing protein [Anaerolineales bacterium]